MRFIYHKNSGDSRIILDSNAFHHIFTVRREKPKIGAIFHFANLELPRIYRYKLLDFGKKRAEFELLDFTQIAQDSPKTHLVCAIISDFDKILPFLNELFVEKITLFYADFSQKNVRINLARMDAIVIHSCEQCGRLSKMKLEILPNLEAVLGKYNNLVALDFGGKCEDLRKLNHFIIGAEGGFSQRERKLLVQNATRIASLKTPLTLRALTAGIFVASQKI